MCVKTIGKADTFDDKSNWQIEPVVRREVYEYIRDNNEDYPVSEEEIDTVIASLAALGYILLHE